MKRISSLPVLQYCPGSDKVGAGNESIRAKRSTVFHKYCETGKWPKEINRLPPEDVEEIRRWKVPTKHKLTRGDFSMEIDYEKSTKELVVAIDKDFNFVDVDPSVPPDDTFRSKYPNVIVRGSLDFGFHFPSFGLVVVVDVKSSIYAVKDMDKSLQLHGYGIGYAKKMGATRYLVGIWDASDGKYYFANDIIEVDSFEYEAYKNDIIQISQQTEENLVTGQHCSGCWDRFSCPSHVLSSVDADKPELRLLTGKASESDVLESLQVAVRLKDRVKLIEDAAKAWANIKGPVLDHKTNKVWGPVLKRGKKSLDQERVMNDLGVSSLDSYMSVGNSYNQYQWKNNK